MGEDGTLFSFRVNDREGRGMKTRERESAYAEEVLVTRADLEEKVREKLKQSIPTVTHAALSMS